MNTEQHLNTLNIDGSAMIQAASLTKAVLTGAPLITLTGAVVVSDFSGHGMLVGTPARLVESAA
jgi:hypothetical protein